mgnify:CR=1 FL=1
MKSQTEVANALGIVDSNKSEFPAMSYEQGVEETLLWVLGEIEDDDFEFSKEKAK